MYKNRVITSECVGYGHPDKIADQVSDALLDAYLEQDTNTRAGIEVMIKDNKVILGGEVRSNATVNHAEIVRTVFKNLYFSEKHNLAADKIEVTNLIGQQSNQIAQGVDHKDGEIGAGDQGFCVGYASAETTTLQPLGYFIANRICRILVDKLREKGIGPDCKSQVTVQYDERGQAHVKHILVSTLHPEGMGLKELRQLVLDTLREQYYGLTQEQYAHYIADSKDIVIDINPCGEWTIGGPVADCGITGRKVVVDQFGGYCNVGGGALSGKDMSKVDRSGAYMATYLARNIVNSGLADWAKVTLSYVIGVTQPSAVDVELDEAHKGNEIPVRNWITSHIDLSPKGIINRFKGNVRFLDTARQGHYGVGQYPWEKLDVTIGI